MSGIDILKCRAVSGCGEINCNLYDMSLNTITIDEKAMRYISIRNNPSFYLDAIKRNCYVLPYIPEEYKTEEICKIAIQRNAYNIFYILPKYIYRYSWFTRYVLRYGMCIRQYDSKYMIPYPSPTPQITMKYELPYHIQIGQIRRITIKITFIKN